MKPYFAIVAIALLLSFTSSTADNHENFLQCLYNYSPNTSKVVYTQTNTSFSPILNFSIQNLRFATNSTPKPLVIVTPLEVSEIQATIICSQRHGMQIRTRSGGHDYEGLSYVSQVPFVIIDLINLREIEVDVENRTAWVQAGATVGELYYMISQKAETLGFPAGVCPTMGVWWTLSGGGYGFLMRKYGLAADNIIDAHIIDVNGKLLDREQWAHSLDARELPRAGFAKSDYVRDPIPDDGLEGLWPMFYEDEAQAAVLIFNPYGGRMDEISESEIPFPHRFGNIYKIQTLVYWQEEGDEVAQRHITGLEDFTVIWNLLFQSLLELHMSIIETLTLGSITMVTQATSKQVFGVLSISRTISTDWQSEDQG
ncbi:Oxygen oxidoreductase covalent FAD-binding site [Sesbania bispinosa]|nr:Oxygen oxidoreductase covalent FAD-binding site [Sesbania bispinosa]